MWIDLIKVVGGLVLLVLGAEWLVRGAAGLALRLGLSSLVVGLTVVAFGTSSPELVVCVKDALEGTGELALGAVVGSNICNILLILGTAAIIFPIHVHKNLFRLDLPVMVLAAFLMTGLMSLGGIARWAGIVMLVLLGGYIFLTIRAGREGTIDPELKEETAELEKTAESPLWMLILLAVAGPVLLSFGADLLLVGAKNIASNFGVSDAVIGLTLVAFGSSLPELATAVVAAIRRNPDIVVGNVVGSNIFNVLCVLGITSLVRPIPFVGITWADLGMMLIVSLLIVPFLRNKFTLLRWEGALLLAGYAGYIGWLVAGA